MLYVIYVVIVIVVVLDLGTLNNFLFLNSV
jgi:hypothetical protein